MAGVSEQGGADPVLRERDARVAYLTINRPPLNILNIACFEALASALASLREGSDVDIVVIRSAGAGDFSAGADVADHAPERAPRMLESFHRVARALWSLPAVSIAAVRGRALGGGMELALCCDLVVASEQAVFGQPEIHVGCFPPIAAALLPEWIGRQRASDLILTGRTIPAAEAHRLGLVSRLESSQRFDEGLRELIAGLEKNSAAVTRCALKALRGSRAEVFSRLLADNERIYLEELLALDDAREGVEAFLGKRRPRWRS